MKAFIVMISIVVSSCFAADAGPWYDYKGNQVRPGHSVSGSDVLVPTVDIVKKLPALSKSQRWEKQWHRSRSVNDRVFYMPRRWGHGCRVPSSYQQLTWRFSYRTPRVNIVINH